MTPAGPYSSRSASSRKASGTERRGRRGRPRRNRRSFPAETVTDRVDGAVGEEARHSSPGARAARLVARRPSGRSSLHHRLLLDMRYRDGKQGDGAFFGMTPEDSSHQVLGDLGEDGSCGDRLWQRHGVCDRAEVAEAHPHRHGPPALALRPQARADPVGKVAERPADDRVLDGPSAERRLRSDRAGADMGPDGARIAVPGEGGQPLARGTAEKPGNRAGGALRQVADGSDAAFGESRPGSPGRRPTSSPPANHGGRRARSPGRRRPARRAWRPGRRSWRGAWCGRRRWRWEGPVRRARAGGSPRRSRLACRRGGCSLRNVGESLVDRDPLDQRREVAQYPDRGVAEPLVLLEVPADEDQVGAKRSRPPSRHAAVDAEGLRFVRRREHHAAPYRDRPPLEGRIEHLFDRSVERVQVRMKDCGRVHGEPCPRRACGVM